MPRPAERAPRDRERRFDIDRTWLWRIVLVIVVVALVALIAKAAMMAFGGGGRRLEVRGDDETRGPIAFVRQPPRPGADRGREIAMLE